MNDAEFEAQKERVEALQRKWLATLGLTPWHITVHYVREPLVQDRTTGTYRVMAETEVHWEYEDATITWDLGMVAKEENDAELEFCVVHELMHVLLAEVHDKYSGSDDDRKHMERACTLAARALIWARKDGYKEGLAAQPEEVLACLP